jgi:hypothetical protein
MYFSFFSVFCQHVIAIESKILITWHSTCEKEVEKSSSNVNVLVLYNAAYFILISLGAR